MGAGVLGHWDVAQSPGAPRGWDLSPGTWGGAHCAAGLRHWGPVGAPLGAAFTCAGEHWPCAAAARH